MILKEIWDAVWKFNSQVIQQHHNQNYSKICDFKGNGDLKKIWLLNYSRALIHECYEYYQEENLIKKEEEFIDILFFLIALYQVGGKNYSVFEKDFESQNYSIDVSLIERALEIEKTISWKHWKIYPAPVEDYNLFYDKLNYFMLNFNYQRIKILNLEKNKLLEIFNNKLKINYERQKKEKINKMDINIFYRYDPMDSTIYIFKKISEQLNLFGTDSQINCEMLSYADLSGLNENLNWDNAEKCVVWKSEVSSDLKAPAREFIMDLSKIIISNKMEIEKLTNIKEKILKIISDLSKPAQEMQN